MTLSTALCRPTSSRTTTRVPSASNSPAACSPPVLPKPGCCSASRSGSESTVSRSSVTGGAGAAAASTSWTVSVPHTPQAELTSRAVGIASGGAARSTVTTLNSSSAVRVSSVQYFTPAMSDGVVTRSCTSHPAASSKSWPGVRIVTATRSAGEWGAATRISSGSSVATRSSWSSRAPSRNSATRVRTDGPGRLALVVLTPLTLGAATVTPCRNRLASPCVRSP